MPTEYEVQRELLRPKLTPEFMDTLIHAVRVVGWTVDLTEIQGFVNELNHIADRPLLSLGDLKQFSNEQ